MKRALRTLRDYIASWAVNYARYVLVLPTILIWFISVFVVVEMSGHWFLQIILIPFGLLMLAFDALFPGFDGSIRIGYGEGQDHIPWAFLGLAYMVAAWILWGLRIGWARLRGTSPRDPGFRERLLLITKLAALISALAFVALRFGVRGDSGGGEYLIPIFLFILLLISGTWAVMVETTADGILRRVSSEKEGAEVSGPVSPGVKEGRTPPQPDRDPLPNPRSSGPSRPTRPGPGSPIAP